MPQQNDFSKGNVPRTVTRLAIPMIAAMLVNALYSVVDRIYIGPQLSFAGCFCACVMESRE